FPGRKAAAVEAARVAEDQGALGRRERDCFPVDSRGELVVGRVVVAQWAPWPELVELAARGAARHVLERACLCVDVDEIEKRLEQVSIIEVAMPPLRRPPILGIGRRRVPEIDILELRPEAEVGVREVEQPRVDPELKPGVIEAELDAVGVLADDKLLPGPPPQRRVATPLLELERGGRVGSKPLAVRLELSPEPLIREELR